MNIPLDQNDPQQDPQRSDTKLAIVPLVYWEAMARTYFGGEKIECDVHEITDATMVQVPSELLWRVMKAYYGGGETEGVGDTGGDEIAPTENVMKYHPADHPVVVPRGRLAKKAKSDARIHAQTDEGSEEAGGDSSPAC